LTATANCEELYKRRLVFEHAPGLIVLKPCLLAMRRTLKLALFPLVDLYGAIFQEEAIEKSLNRFN
jgi:hypothetical protein